MIKIDNTLISDRLLEEKFVCDLSACKGACCVLGDAGAPLENSEANLLENEIENIKPFMSEKGKQVIENKGVFEIDTDGEFVTPLVERKECAFVKFDKNGTAKCSIEAAYHMKKTTFPKPISCHLYPVRIAKIGDNIAVNYHQQYICKPACVCGDKLNVKVYRFLKKPLIRKFGEKWFNKLEMVQSLMNRENQENNLNN